MQPVDREIDRYLTLLRNKIREKDLTQIEVQHALGWGRSYISQLMTQQKKLRVDQVLQILNVIGVEPEVFFAELYVHGSVPGLRYAARPSAGAARAAAEAPEPLREEMKRVGLLTQALVRVLREKGLITASDLRGAIREAEASGA